MNNRDRKWIFASSPDEQRAKQLYWGRVVFYAGTAKEEMALVEFDKDLGVLKRYPLKLFKKCLLLRCKPSELVDKLNRKRVLPNNPRVNRSQAKKVLHGEGGARILDAPLPKALDWYNAHREWLSRQYQKVLEEEGSVDVIVVPNEKLHEDVAFRKEIKDFLLSNIRANSIRYIEDGLEINFNNIVTKKGEHK